MNRLNYHHLYYFWCVARQGNLTKTAEQLHISQSALSSQIKQLEHTMGVQLFVREGRKLVLTETGHHTLSYADDIFKKGEELEILLSQGLQPSNTTIQIGMLSTMSRNFIETFLAPLLSNADIRYSLHARDQSALLNELSNHQLDLALTNIEVSGAGQQLWQTQLLARQAIAIVGPPGLDLGKRFSKKYHQQRWVLPVRDNPIRSAFDSLCAQHQFNPEVIAEANDMAMLRLLARDTGAIAVIPDVVVKDELEMGRLKHYLTLPNVYENFYAVTVKRHFPNQVISNLLSTAIRI